MRGMLRVASWCLVAYWSLLFLATHLPSTALPELRAADKMCHFAAFGGLAFLIAWALPSRQGRLALNLGCAALLAIGYGLFDELSQTMIPGRHCDYWDLLADAAGVVAGLAAYLAGRLVLNHFLWGRQLVRRLARTHS